MNIDDKLSKVKYVTDNNSHLNVDKEVCKTCKSKICTIVCPANVYEWNENEKKVIINFENCLECGACRIACEKQNIDWKYPKGTKGITYKLG